MAFEGLADLHFRLTVDIRRVEEIDARIQRAMNQRHRRVVILHAAGVDVRDADAHAAKSDGGHVRTWRPNLRVIIFRTYHAGLAAEASAVRGAATERRRRRIQQATQRSQPLQFS